MIQKALCVVTRGFDNQENLAVCNYSKVTNTLKLTTGNKAVQPVQNMFNGYVINSTEALYQNDMDYAMTMGRAKVFCSTLVGIFQPKWGFIVAVDLYEGTCRALHACLNCI